MNITRKDIIKIRRGLIDKLEAMLPKCQLFKESAIYPRRYFDDLMVQDVEFDS